MTASLPPTRRAPRPVSAAGAPNFLPSHRPLLAHLSCCAFPRGARRANGRGSRVRRAGLVAGHVACERWGTFCTVETV